MLFPLLKRYYSMKKMIFAVLIFLSFLLFGGSANLHAETVSQKQAADMAQLFFNQANLRVTAPVKMVYNGRQLTTNRLFVPFYIFNSPTGGFVIISAENKAFPILGYSLKENFNPDNLGEKEKALLSSYAKDIEYIRYDSSIPEEAIKAWSNYPEFITSLLGAEYIATDPRISMEEASDIIYNLIDTGKALETASDIYTPSQWIEMINKELDSTKSVALGLIMPGEVVRPSIIYGHKGDYYRIELDRRNQWLMRILPTEILSGAQIASFSFPTEIPLEIEEEAPFNFIDTFIAEIEQEAKVSQEKIEKDRRTLIPDQPVINNIGGGHFEILLPENVIISSVYNLSGALTKIQTFKSTNVAHIDLSPEPSGFYLINLIGESGKNYGLKVSR